MEGVPSLDIRFEMSVILLLLLREFLFTLAGVAVMKGGSELMTPISSEKLFSVFKKVE